MIKNTFFITCFLASSFHAFATDSSGIEMEKMIGTKENTLYVQRKDIEPLNFFQRYWTPKSRQIGTSSWGLGEKICVGATTTILLGLAGAASYLGYYYSGGNAVSAPFTNNTGEDLPDINSTSYTLTASPFAQSSPPFEERVWLEDGEDDREDEDSQPQNRQGRCISSQYNTFDDYFAENEVLCRRKRIFFWRYYHEQKFNYTQNYLIGIKKQGLKVSWMNNELRELLNASPNSTYVFVEEKGNSDKGTSTKYYITAETRSPIYSALRILGKSRSELPQDSYDNRRLLPTLRSALLRKDNKNVSAFVRADLRLHQEAFTSASSRDKREITREEEAKIARQRHLEDRKPLSWKQTLLNMAARW